MLTAIFFEPPLTNVTWTLSPWLTTIGGLAAVPRYAVPLTAKLQASVGASCGSTWVTCWRTSTVNFFTGPAGTAGSVGSTFSKGSNAMPFDWASVGAGLSAAAGAAAGRLTTVCVAWPESPLPARAKMPTTIAMIARTAVSATATNSHSRRGPLGGSGGMEATGTSWSGSMMSVGGFTVGS